MNIFGVGHAKYDIWRCDFWLLETVTDISQYFLQKKNNKKNS